MYFAVLKDYWKLLCVFNISIGESSDGFFNPLNNIINLVARPDEDDFKDKPAMTPQELKDLHLLRVRKRFEKVC